MVNFHKLLDKMTHFLFIVTIILFFVVPQAQSMHVNRKLLVKLDNQIEDEFKDVTFYFNNPQNTSERAQICKLQDGETHHNLHPQCLPPMPPDATCGT